LATAFVAVKIGKLKASGQRMRVLRPLTDVLWNAKRTLPVRPLTWPPATSKTNFNVSILVTKRSQLQTLLAYEVAVIGTYRPTGCPITHGIHCKITFKTIFCICIYLNYLQHLFNKVLYQNASKRHIQHIRSFAQSAQATIHTELTQPFAPLRKGHSYKLC
jgi:hypothetical protein